MNAMDTNELAAVERATAGTLLLACNEESPLDQLAEMSMAIDFAYEQAKANREARDKLFESRIKKAGGFTLGTKRYWLSHPKTVKCKSLAKTLPAVMAACCGDEEAIARVLSANAFKVGQCRTLLDGAFDDHFETVVRDKLETGEAAPLELVCADEAFVKPKRK